MIRFLFWSVKERKLIHKRQKLIKITDRYKDSWQVLEEYESDQLASKSEDENKLKKVKEVVGRKRKARQESKHIKINGRRFFMLLLTISSFMVGSCLTFESILCSFYSEFKVQINLCVVEQSELERNMPFTAV